MKVLTISQAARKINMSEQMLRRYVRGQKLKTIKYSERNTRIEENELIRFLHLITKDKK